MKQMIKFGKARMARYGAIRVESYEQSAEWRKLTVRAGVAQVKSL